MSTDPIWLQYAVWGVAFFCFFFGAGVGFWVRAVREAREYNALVDRYEKQRLALNEYEWYVLRLADAVECENEERVRMYTKYLEEVRKR